MKVLAGIKVVVDSITGLTRLQLATGFPLIIPVMLCGLMIVIFLVVQELVWPVQRLDEVFSKSHIISWR